MSVEQVDIGGVPVERWVNIMVPPDWIDHWEWNVVRAYIRMAADRCELRDWTIIVSAEPAPKEEGSVTRSADISHIIGRKRATMRLAPDWTTRMNEDCKRQCLVHELVHCHFNPLMDILYGEIRNQLGEPAWQVLKCYFTRQMEFGVDALADAIAPNLPPYPKRPTEPIGKPC